MFPLGSVGNGLAGSEQFDGEDSQRRSNVIMKFLGNTCALLVLRFDETGIALQERFHCELAFGDISACSNVAAE